MKRILALLCVVILLSGCSASNDTLDRAMALRAQMLAKGASFDAEITADYGDRLHTFAMSCVTDQQGNLTFTVTAPESIAGITGKVSTSGGKLTFDDHVLSFGLMADGLVSPVSGPWVLIKTLRSGYLTSCTKEGDLLRLSVDDSYEEDALHLDIWLGDGDLPVNAEVLWQGRRLLSIAVKNFTLL